MSAVGGPVSENEGVWLADLLRDLAGDDRAIESINYGGGIHPRLFAGRHPEQIRSVLVATADFLEFHR